MRGVQVGCSLDGCMIRYGSVWVCMANGHRYSLRSSFLWMLEVDRKSVV